MRLVLRLAIRNLRRNLRRSFLTMLTITLGLATILWLDSILEGRNENIIKSVTSTYTGHIQIYSKDYLKTKLLQKTYPEFPPNMRAILPPATRIAGRIHLPSLISSGEESLPVLLEGIDPAQEPQITQVMANRVSGEFLPSESDPDCALKSVYIGKELASLLNVGLGGKLVVLVQAADGTLGNDLFKVRGVYDSGSPDFDRTRVYTTLPCAARIGALHGIHETVIRLEEAAGAEALRKRLQESNGPSLEVTTWRQSLPGLATMVKYNEVTHVMISSMLLVLICFGIINTLLISVFDRTREFGVMAALGTSPVKIQSIVLTECFVLGATSCFFGIIIALIVTFYHRQYGFDLKPFLGNSSSLDDFKLDLVVYPYFHFQNWIKATLITLLTIVFAGFIPAFRASRLRPIEAMRSL